MRIAWLPRVFQLNNESSGTIVLPNTVKKSKLARFDYYVEGRAFEWIMGIAMLFAGIELLVWPNTISFGAFQWILLVMSQYFLALFMVLIGWGRICGLMLNGQTIFDWKIGPYIRALCSVLSATIWVQCAFALFIGGMERNAPSFGFPFWTMFTVGELYVAYTTVKNA